MSSIEFPAPAKINLSLRVLGKRDDGFHEIETRMISLPGLADRIRITPSDRVSVTCDDPELPTGEENLVIKAVRAFERAAGLTWTGHIHLEKTIPHGAGLGGGSSDAATVLRMLNEITGSPLTDETMIGAAASIGSDIPFFLGTGSAVCRGRGELLSEAPAPPCWNLLLLKPWFGVSTPDAYRRWSGARRIVGVPYEIQPVDGQELVNDLETPVFEKHRFLAEMKSWLLSRSEVRAALMSGSGSCMFAVLHDGTDGEQVARCARDELDPGLWHWCGATTP